MKASLTCRSGQSLGVATLLMSVCAMTAQAQGVAQCAQIPCDDVRTVAAASTGVPVEHDFTATAGTTYYVTLTDLGAQPTLAQPQPLATLKMAITANDALVNVTPIVGANTVAATTQLVVDGANAVSTNGVAMASFTATTAGAYRFHIIGDPTTGNAPGPIGLVVSATQGGAPLQSWSDSIGPAGPPPATAEGILQQTFTVASAGAYQISVTDLALPQMLQGAPQLIVLLNGAEIALLPDASHNNALTTTATLQTGTYQIFAVGLATTQAGGGLFSASVIPATTGGGAPAFSWTVPVGTTIAVGSAVQLMPGAQFGLALKDLVFPSALSQVAAVAVDISLGTVAATGTTASVASFTAAGAGAGDTYQIYAAAQAAPTPGAGSYSARILSSSGTALSGSAEAVTTSTSPLLPFSFTTDVPSAGAYTASLTDLQLPSPLSTAEFAMVQGGVIVGTPSTSAGSIAASLAAGSASLELLGFAQSSTTGGSLLDLSVTNSSNALVFDQPLGVGTAFKTTQISIPTKGSYQFTLADLAWPASFSQSGGQLTGVLTQGGTVVGEIFGGGTLSAISVTTAGNYYLSIIATPTGSDQAGTYALNVSQAPAAPTVNLTADAMTVSSGGTVHLIWTTTGATSCTASGGGWSGSFTGSQVASDTVTSPAITATTTFTLTCTGPGGQTAGSVTVTLAAAGSSGASKGGGGVLGEFLLLVLGSCVFARRLVRHFAVVGALLGLGALLAGCGGAQSRLASHMQRGQAYYAQGDFAKARVEFRNAMQIAPKDVEARLMAGRAAESLGRSREALGLYQSVVDSGVPNAEASADLARVLLYGGAAKQALDIIQPALRRFPDDPVLLTLRAATGVALKDPVAAVTDVERALKVAPTNEEAIEVRARLYRDAGDLAAATALVSSAVDRAPASRTLRGVLVDLYLAGNQPERAEQQLRELVRLAPQEPRYRYQLAAFYTSRQRFDDAQHVLEDAVKALPADAQAKLLLVDFISTHRTRAQGEQLLRDLIAREPDNYDLRLAHGALLQRTGATPAAIAIYQEIVQKSGTAPQGLIARDRLAAIAAEQSRYEDAGKLIHQVLDKNPRDNDALLLSGRIALIQNHPAEAVADLRAVLRDQPAAVPVWRLLAQAYLANDEPGLAEESLHTALDEAPGDTSLRVEMAQLLIRSNKVEAAVSLLEEAAKSAAPGDLAVRDMLARAYLDAHNFAAAGREAAELQTLKPDSAEGYYVAGMAAQGQNRPDDAARAFQHALALQPTALDSLSALARLEYSRGQAPQAIALVRKAADAQPTNAFARNLLGELYMTQKNLPAATDAFNQAIKLAPQWWVPYRSLAAAKFSAKDVSGAITAYQAAIKVAPNEPQLAVELATIYEHQGSPNEAIACYEAGYQHNAHAQQVANNLAMMLVTYRTDAASLNRAHELTSGFAASTDANLLDTSGWVSFKRAEYGQALPLLERAAQGAPDSKEIRYHLGLAELRSGLTDRARTDLQIALAGASRFPWSNEARAALASIKGPAGQSG
jgi:tetratricopeptide (TPR) repeat protein